MSGEGNELGDDLRARRQGMGWSLADVARRTGLSRAYISALERGRSKRPSADTLRRLESVLGVVTTESELDAPEGLAAFALEEGLSPTDVSALARLTIRGRQPESKERWAFIYQALLASESIDDEQRVYQRRPGMARET